MKTAAIVRLPGAQIAASYQAGETDDLSDAPDPVMAAAMTAVDALMAATAQAFVVAEPDSVDGDVGTDRTRLQPAQPALTLQTMQSMRPRGRGRRGNRGSGAGNPASVIGMSDDLLDDLDDDDDGLPDYLRDARLVPDAPAPAASTPAGVAGVTATQAQSDALLVHGLALLTAATSLGRPAGAVSAAHAKAEADRKTAVKATAADHVAITSEQGRHGQTDSDDSSDGAPAPAVQAADNAPSGDAVDFFDVGELEAGIGIGDGALPLGLSLYLPPLMNRRLETNGVDDGLILERAYLREPERRPRTPAGPPAVTEMTPVPARLPPVSDPVIAEAENRRGNDTEVVYPMPFMIALQRGPRRRWLRRTTSRIKAGARPLPHWLSGRHGSTAASIPLTSDPRSPGAVECADFWAGGYAMPARLFYRAGMRTRGT